VTASALAHITEALHGTYTVAREIGQGGMACVYLAADLRHRRQVAIKVLRPELGAALGPERFLREIEFAARLQHPHILPVFDSGRIGETTLYYVMPFVPGESLRQRLGREGPLRIEDALRFAREVADALGYAHAQGVVHRDIKPENILLAADHAVVADFGIARAIVGGVAGGGDEAALTATGFSLGTPSYMSPEQAHGSAELDGRTDIYSLGCVLYEMLTGVPPFTGPNAQALLARHAVDPVPPIRTVRATVPEAVERVVRRALAKVPADRYATAVEFANALEITIRTQLVPPPARGRRPKAAGITALTAAALAIGALGWWAAARTNARASGGPAAAAPPPESSVAVLSFDNLSPDTADAYLAQGVGEEIASRLSDFPGVRVAGRGAVGRLQRAATADLLGQARQLRVGYLVEGSVRRAESRVRVSVRLVNASDGFRTWSRSYDHAVGNILDLQDQIGADVVRAVAGRAASGAPSPAKGRTRDPAAYDQLLHGNYYLSQRSPRSLALAIEAYTQAVRHDPSYAVAHGRLAYAYGLLFDWGWRLGGLPRDSIAARAARAADRAIQLDSTIAEAWLARGQLARLVEPRAMDDAVEASRRAVAIDSTNAEAHHELGMVLRLAGNDSEAAVHLRHAVALDNDRPMSLVHLGWIDAAAGRHADARRWFDSAIVLHPGFFQAYAERAPLRLALGDTSGARADAETAVRLRPVEDQFSGEGVLLALERGRNLPAAGQHFTALLARAPRPDTTQVHAAIAWAAALVGAGEHRRAIEFLEQVRADPPHLRLHLRDLHFEPIRGDPRFRLLLRQER
jgi:TolB-like protein